MTKLYYDLFWGFSFSLFSYFHFGFIFFLFLWNFHMFVCVWAFHYSLAEILVHALQMIWNCPMSTRNAIEFIHWRRWLDHEKFRRWIVLNWIELKHSILTLKCFFYFILFFSQKLNHNLSIPDWHIDKGNWKGPTIHFILYFRFFFLLFVDDVRTSSMINDFKWSSELKACTIEFKPN